MNKNLFAMLIIFSGVGLCTIAVAAEDKALEQKEIGQAVTLDIKSVLKSPFLDFLASSELVTWREFKVRFDAVKKAIDSFESKYSNEFKGDVPAPVAVAKSVEIAVVPEPSVVQAPADVVVEKKSEAPAPAVVPSVPQAPEKAPEVVTKSIQETGAGLVKEATGVEKVSQAEVSVATPVPVEKTESSVVVAEPSVPVKAEASAVTPAV